MSPSETLAALRLEHRFADALPELVMDWSAVEVPRPQIVVANRALAAELGLPDTPAELISGNTVPEGARPVAMAYAGHQFGHYSPRLGDGRALLLGEVIGPDGTLRDLHLKGSGRTPFARGGDGLASLGPMLREFLIAEAMDALGIPTSRPLAVITTGTAVQREHPEPGAILARVAASHIRVGTFEYAARLGDIDVVRRLADHAMDRHHPGAADAERPALALLQAVIDSQASLVASWMLVGFIHGVMNTDNTFISGETLDYGPCAFMDTYDPATVFSSIDRGGRYAYGNQPTIAQWNLARLAETLLPLIDDDADVAVELATEAVESFSRHYRSRWLAGMSAKLGLTHPDNDASRADRTHIAELADELMTHLAAARADMTGSFRALAAWLRDEDHWALPDLEQSPALSDWMRRWREELPDRDLSALADQMDLVNPAVIPRNHLVDDALSAAEAGDMDPFGTVLTRVRLPFDSAGATRFERPAPDDFTDQFQTFCGT